MKRTKKVRLTVGNKRSSYVGRPGSTKDLFPVYFDGEAMMEVGPRNMWNLRPGDDFEADVTVNDESFLFPRGRVEKIARCSG